MWADAGDRSDPDDATHTPVLVRTVGWPFSYSTDDGETPVRQRMNQRLRELDGAARGAMLFGIEPYDPEIDYPVNAKCAVGRDLYNAVAANGPASGNATNPTTPGQTVWETVQGAVSLPNAPNAPNADATNGRLDWSWNCPKDNGAEITGFVFQWRAQGSVWLDANRVVIASASGSRYTLAGLANGTTYEARVYATNARGDSPWSGIGNGTPQAGRPGRVASVVALGGAA